MTEQPVIAYSIFTFSFSLLFCFERRTSTMERANSVPLKVESDKITHTILSFEKLMSLHCEMPVAGQLCFGCDLRFLRLIQSLLSIFFFYNIFYNFSCYKWLYIIFEFEMTFWVKIVLMNGRKKKRWKGMQNRNVKANEISVAVMMTMSMDSVGKIQSFMQHNYFIMIGNH